MTTAVSRVNVSSNYSIRNTRHSKATGAGNPPKFNLTTDRRTCIKLNPRRIRNLIPYRPPRSTAFTMRLFITLASLALAVALPTEPTKPDHNKIIPISPIPYQNFKPKKLDPVEPDPLLTIPVMPIPVPFKQAKKKNEVRTTLPPTQASGFGSHNFRSTSF